MMIINHHLCISLLVVCSTSDHHPLLHHWHLHHHNSKYHYDTNNRYNYPYNHCHNHYQFIVRIIIVIITIIIIIMTVMMIVVSITIVINLSSLILLLQWPLLVSSSFFVIITTTILLRTAVQSWDFSSCRHSKRKIERCFALKVYGLQSDPKNTVNILVFWELPVFLMGIPHIWWLICCIATEPLSGVQSAWDKPRNKEAICGLRRSVV